jgi:hypothetical protein
MPRRRSLLWAPVQLYIRRTSLRRGVFGEDRFWRLVYRVTYGPRIAHRMRENVAWRSVYSTASAVRLARRVIKPHPQHITVGKLRPGEIVRIEVVDPRSAVRSAAGE